MSAACLLQFTEYVVLNHYETRRVVRETCLYPKPKEGCSGRDTHWEKNHLSLVDAALQQVAERSPGRLKRPMKEVYGWDP